MAEVLDNAHSAIDDISVTLSTGERASKDHCKREVDSNENSFRQGEPVVNGAASVSEPVMNDVSTDSRGSPEVEPTPPMQSEDSMDRESTSDSAKRDATPSPRPASATSPPQVAYPPMNFPGAAYPFFSNPFMAPMVPGQQFPSTEMPITFPQPPAEPGAYPRMGSNQELPSTADSLQPPAGSQSDPLAPPVPGVQQFNPYVYQEMVIRYFQAMMQQANVPMPAGFPTAPAFMQQPGGPVPQQHLSPPGSDWHAAQDPAFSTHAER